MRVIHVTYDATFYGIGRFLYNLLNYQINHYKYDDFAIVFHSGHKNIKNFDKIGIHVYCLNEKSPKNIVIFFKFLRILRDYDIVNFHTYSPWAFLAAWALKKKTIFTFHGSFGFRKTWRDLPLKYFYRLGINRRCKKITFATQTSKSIYVEKIKKIFHQEKIALFPYGLQIDKIAPKKSKELVRSLFSADGKFIVGTAARMDPVKRLEFLIEAFSRLSYIKDAELWIAGDGDEKYLRYLSSQAKTLGIEKYVRFLGFREDIYDILNAVDIFVLPSFRETFGMSLLEAMALGVPSIAFQDGGGAIDILGDSGFLVRDINDLGQALERLRSDSNLRLKLSQRAKKRALDFDIEHTANNFQKIYTELANK